MLIEMPNTQNLSPVQSHFIIVANEALALQVQQTNMHVSTG
jgi:hypothetical protein